MAFKQTYLILSILGLASANEHLRVSEWKEVHSLLNTLVHRVLALEQKVERLEKDQEHRRLVDEECVPDLVIERNETTDQEINRYCRFRDITYNFQNRTEFSGEGRAVFDGRTFFNGDMIVNGDISFDNDATCMPVFDSSQDRCVLNNNFTFQTGSVDFQDKVSFLDDAKFRDRVEFEGEPIRFENDVYFYDDVTFDLDGDHDVWFKGNGRVTVDTKHRFKVYTKAEFDDHDGVKIKKGDLNIEHGDINIKDGDLEVDGDAKVKHAVKADTFQVGSDSSYATLKYGSKSFNNREYKGVIVDKSLYANKIGTTSMGVSNNIITDSITANHYNGNLPSPGQGGDLVVDSLKIGGSSGVLLKYGSKSVLGTSFKGLVVEGDAFATRFGTNDFGSNQGVNVGTKISFGNLGGGGPIITRKSIDGGVGDGIQIEKLGVDKLYAKEYLNLEVPSLPRYPRDIEVDSIKLGSVTIDYGDREVGQQTYTGVRVGGNLIASQVGATSQLGSPTIRGNEVIARTLDAVTVDADNYELDGVAFDPLDAPSPPAGGSCDCSDEIDPLKTDITALQGDVSLLREDFDALPDDDGNGDCTCDFTDVQSEIDALEDSIEVVDAKVETAKTTFKENFAQKAWVTEQLNDLGLTTECQCDLDDYATRDEIEDWVMDQNFVQKGSGNAGK